MKKVFTLFCALMVCVLFSGVANAQSPVVFHTSDAPTATGWGANTYWYYITLKDKVISSSVGDSDGFKMESTTTKSGDEAMWCVVGDATNGYRFYNKKAGFDKVLGLSNVEGTGNDNNYGASRAKMYDATTSHSTASTGTGTNFGFELQNGTEYYVKLKGTDYRYLNDRTHLAYWNVRDALGNDGSRMKFYAVDYNSEYASALAAAENLISNKNGLQATYTATDKDFLFGQQAFSTLSKALEVIEKPKTEAEAETAIASINQAKSTFLNSENLPAVGSKVIFKNNYNNFYLSGSGVDMLAQTAYDKRGYLYGLPSKSLNSVWILEKGSAERTFKLKNYVTGFYACGYPEGGRYGYTQDANSGSDYFISSAGGFDGSCSIGGSLESNNWMQCNYGNVANVNAPSFKQLYGGGALWGAGRWTMTYATDEDLKLSMNLDDIDASGFSAFPFITSDGAYVEAKTAFAQNPTAENYAALLKVAKDKLCNTYLRFKASNDNSEAKMFNMSISGNAAKGSKTTTTEKNDISNIWQLKISGTGFKLYNVNHKKWLSVLNEAKPGGSVDPEMKDNENEGSKYTINYSAGNFSFIDSNGKWMQIENDGRINWWSGSQYLNNSTTWKFSEAEDITIALHTAADAKSYASVYLPFSVSSVTGAKAYVAKDPETTMVTFSETAEGVKAQNGFLLISEAGEATATLNIGESNITSAMGGTLLDLTLNEADKAQYRVFGQKKSDETVIGFFKPSATLNTISANRAFFTNATGEALRLNFDGVISGIETTELNNALNNNAPIYDLSGRRVMNAVKGGLYIQNGRKFIVK